MKGVEPYLRDEVDEQQQHKRGKPDGRFRNSVLVDDEVAQDPYVASRGTAHTRGDALLLGLAIKYVAPNHPRPPNTVDTPPPSQVSSSRCCEIQSKSAEVLMLPLFWAKPCLQRKLHHSHGQDRAEVALGDL
jgi:hypothetical protein